MHIRRFFPLAWAVFLVFSIAAHADAPALDPDVNRLRPQILAIESCRMRGELGKCHLEFAEQAKGSTDPLAQLVVAWSNPDEETAWSELRKLADNDPNNAWPHLGMARIYDRWKVRDQALQELTRAAALSPGLSGMAASFRCDIHRHLEDFAAASKDAAEAMNLDVSDPMALQCDGLAHRAQGDAKGAIEQLELAAAAQPDLFETALALAELYAQDGDSTKAIERYQAVTKLAPKYRDARLALGGLLEKTGDFAGAAAEDERALALSKASDKALTAKLANLYGKLGRTSDEGSQLRKVAAANPKEVAPWKRLAEIDHARGDESAENDDLQAVVSRDPSDVAAYQRIGAIAQKHGDNREAISAYLSAQHADPASKTASSALAALRTKLSIADPPFEGTHNVNNIYQQVFGSLSKVYAARRKETPRLRGSLKMKVTVAANGHASRVELVENKLNDATLEENVYWNLRLAIYPSVAKSYTFAFELRPR